MNIWFFVLAALMLAAALICVLLPLVRAGRRNGRTRMPFILSLLIAFALPPVALGLYAWIGTPSALNAPAADTGKLDFAQATAELRAKLQRSPGHPEGWLLLGQAYTAMNRPADARDAFGYALKLKPDDPDIMVAFAEADAQARSDHRIEGDSRKLLERAIALAPDHQRGLWLLGISDYQLGHFDDALAHWKRLLTLLQPGSSIATAVDGQIAMAQARAQGKTQAEAEVIAQAVAAQAAPAAATSVGTESRTTSAKTDADATTSVALKVDVKLDPKLAGKVSPGETLFVYARAVNGPPMPLAVARLKASALPASVTLTDAMAMTPQLKLSSFPRVQVSARISKSGNAMPQSGDLEAQPVQVASDAKQPVALTIDRVR
ncbi:MAG TPA: tetratricopeptide repeat protein [Rhodanobacteraceae bacterium]|nr:tetratricopeptide repeat protein [Rhodanobacteraceae bacterium]